MRYCEAHGSTLNFERAFLFFYKPGSFDSRRRRVIAFMTRKKRDFCGALNREKGYLRFHFSEQIGFREFLIEILLQQALQKIFLGCRYDPRCIGSPSTLTRVSVRSNPPSPSTTGPLRVLPRTFNPRSVLENITALRLRQSIDNPLKT